VSAAADVAARLRARRFGRGAMQLERPELVIELDGEGGVEHARWEAEPDAHALIEELMIAANEAVAAFLERSRAELLYRVHPEPDPQAIAGLITRLSALDVPTPPQPEHLTPRGAAALAAQIAERVATYVGGHGGAEALTTLVLRSLEQASYRPTNVGHAGLASAAYCHFTSPIRRYPDLVAHRALLERLGVGDPLAELDLDGLGEHCSRRERELAAIEHQANDICLAWLLDRVLYDEGWETEFDGEVIGLISSGLFLRFGEVFEGYLPARALPGDYFELDELGVSLAGRRSGRRYRLGDVVPVRVDTLNRRDGRVKLALSGNSARR
jgi:ribonuclease R